MIMFAKIATALGWLVIIANWITPFSPQMFPVIHYSGLGLLIAHAIETAVFLPKAKKLDDNLALHAVQLFVFGYPHNMQIDALLKQQVAET